MSFWLTDESKILKLFSGKIGGITSHSIPDLQTSISQLDTHEASIHLMQTVDDSFQKKLSCNANRYVSEVLSWRHRFLRLRNSMAITFGSDVYLSLKLEGHMLKILKDVFGEDLEVRVVLTGMIIRMTGALLPTVYFYTDTFTSKEMRISVNPNTPRHPVDSLAYNSAVMEDCYYGIALGVCQYGAVTLPLEQIASGTSVEVEAKIRVEVAISGFNSPMFLFRNASVMTSRLSKEILDDGIHADLKIIASNGKVIEAHKCFLAARSRVFRAMFRNDCKESLSNTIKLTEMSETGVKALLAFLYYGDLDEADKKSEIALELFEAGHKYEVPSLEVSAGQIFLRQSKQWTDVSVALRLFTFAGRLGEYEDIKAKAVDVMKLKFEELKSTEEYNDLFRRDPVSAKDLCSHLFLR